MVSLIVRFYLRGTGYYIAVAFVCSDDDTFGGDLTAGHLEGRRDGAAFEQAFSGAEGDPNYHQLHLIDEVVFEKRLEKIRASHGRRAGPYRYAEAGGVPQYSFSVVLKSL